MVLKRAPWSVFHVEHATDCRLPGKLPGFHEAIPGGNASSLNAHGPECQQVGHDGMQCLTGVPEKKSARSKDPLDVHRRDPNAAK